MLELFTLLNLARIEILERRRCSHCKALVWPSCLSRSVFRFNDYTFHNQCYRELRDKHFQEFLNSRKPQK